MKLPIFLCALVDQPGESQVYSVVKRYTLVSVTGGITLSLGRFSAQRRLHNTVEDFHNPEGMNQYLVHYLENMGAQVLPQRKEDSIL